MFTLGDGDNWYWLTYISFNAQKQLHPYLNFSSSSFHTLPGSQWSISFCSRDTQFVYRNSGPTLGRTLWVSFCRRQPLNCFKRGSVSNVCWKCHVWSTQFDFEQLNRFSFLWRYSWHLLQMLDMHERELEQEGPALYANLTAFNSRSTHWKCAEINSQIKIHATQQSYIDTNAWLVLTKSQKMPWWDVLSDPWKEVLQHPEQNSPVL